MYQLQENIIHVISFKEGRCNQKLNPFPFGFALTFLSVSHLLKLMKVCKPVIPNNTYREVCHCAV